MSSKKRNALIMLIIMLVLAIAIIVSLVLLILQRTGLDSITISPEFTDMQLDINGDYKIIVKTSPDGSNISKFDYNIDSSSATFTVFDDNSAILHTSSEGEVTISVSKGSVKSNELTFKIVDKAAQEAANRAAEEALAAEQAAAEAAQAAEAAAAEETQTAELKHIRVIKDSVNVRGDASTDSEALGKAKKGDTFDVLDETTVGNYVWYKIKFGDKDGYIRNDLVEITDGTQASNTAATEEKKEEAKKEENTQQQEQQQQQAANTDEASQANAQAAQAAQDQMTADALAQIQAQQIADALAAATPVAWSYGGANFSAEEVNVFKGEWGDAWTELAPHHSVGELKQLARLRGVPEAKIL